MVNKMLKKMASELRPQFNLGKSGITDTFIQTIDEYLGAHKIVKIKSSLAEDKDMLVNLAKEVADKTEAEIIDKRGFTFTLFRQ